MLPTMSWTWKSDQIWRRLVHFFVAMVNWIAASPVSCTEGESVDNWHWFRASSRPLQIREAPWNDCCSHMAIQEQSWRPKEIPEAAKLSLFHFQLGAGFVIETWPRPCKKAMGWCQEVKLNWPVLNCVVFKRHSYRYLSLSFLKASKRCSCLEKLPWIQHYQQLGQE